MRRPLSARAGWALADALIAAEQRLTTVEAEVVRAHQSAAAARVRDRLRALSESGRLTAEEHATWSEHVPQLVDDPGLLELAESRPPPLRGYRLERGQDMAAKVRERVEAILVEAKGAGRKVSRLQAAAQAARELGGPPPAA
jgi:hypothetical protein